MECKERTAQQVSRDRRASKELSVIGILGMAASVEVTEPQVVRDQMEETVAPEEMVELEEP